MDDPRALDSVSDSTDWLTTPLLGLAAVEAALRCQVCKDFYKTPMLTSCHHTFCSLCIRRALSNDGRCPLCRASEQEMRLRSNWSMEEVVAAFTRTRTDVLVFAQRPEVTSSESSVKRKVDEMSDGAVGSPRLSRRLRSSTRPGKSRQQNNVEPSFDWSEEDELECEEEYEPSPEPQDGLVACPICWQRMKALQVDKHIDTSCPGEPQPQPQKRSAPSLQSSRSTSSSIPNGGPSRSAPSRNYERLPALNYSMMKEAQLRKKMAELGLSTAGNRQMLERRHKEWTTIWNANCDALHPRRKTELLHDLDVWERTLGSRAPTNSKSINLGAQIKDKDFDAAGWAEKHHTSFQDLISSARIGRTKAQQQQQQQQANDATKEKADSEPKPSILPAGSEIRGSQNANTETPQSYKTHKTNEVPGPIDLTGDDDTAGPLQTPKLVDRARRSIEHAPPDKPGTPLIS
ncbi:hypothetical protein F5B20DRAFT_558471 [Whalleya microplaca]|nr:hypothetical protein F5B20DRAFT_558471 [Whalleya microplaca]